MAFLVTLACSFVAVLLLRKPIAKAPLAFYALSAATVVACVASAVFDMPRLVWTALFVLEQKCILPLALFTIVMFVGCFSTDSFVSRCIRPIRSELSIIAWILSLAHVAVYVQGYVPRILGGGALAGNVAVSFGVAAVLLAVLLVLGVTSFHVVKRCMPTALWTKVQRGAYVFFGLAFVHVSLMLTPSALQGGRVAQVSIAVYVAVFALYACLRIARALHDRGDRDRAA
ncbi:hypothetical protein B5F40_09140 [Gordonibacter sp. An230]|uniref:hypothetical protein n=1 Tax=Gordonibacter sp. An230 TaxID=1965592 RepID=UPI000B37F418|nr:hypothetical protein [Gordonibacter sp. An230]OUO89837.1 hypothetical protein B5F40_09140 [Gordonibacter sp. An230]